MTLAAAPSQALKTGAAAQAESHAVRPATSRTGQRIGQAVRWMLLILVSLAFMYPFAWLLAASLKPRGEVFDNRLIPETFSPQNYVEVWERLPLLA
jgi:multiple sugar transport system permease protein